MFCCVPAVRVLSQRSIMIRAPWLEIIRLCTWGYWLYCECIPIRSIYVSMYLCMCVCMYVLSCTHTHIYTYTHIYIYIHIYMCIFTYIHISIYTYTMLKWFMQTVDWSFFSPLSGPADSSIHSIRPSFRMACGIQELDSPSVHVFTYASKCNMFATCMKFHDNSDLK